MTIVLVAAVGKNNVIGRGGHLPWRLRSDLQHFKRLTLNKPVVMGRKTFESLGKPLKDRTNIVVSRNLAHRAPGAILTTSIDAALAIARDDAKKRGTDEIMVIGGHNIFDVTLPLANRLEITHVHASPEGDVFFPPIDPSMWCETYRREHPAGPQDDFAFTVATYQRR
ncbi:MAG: dihydrofolate reductase [Pseudolabrys sp.]|nr:dihydrofolate reductase [Pseudolabrys sp.]